VNHHALPALTAALLIVVSPVLADDLKTVEAGKLTWGSSPTFKPFEFMRDGKAQGFDVVVRDCGPSEMISAKLPARSASNPGT
jgi:hypothetical protein